MVLTGPLVLAARFLPTVLGGVGGGGWGRGGRPDRPKTAEPGSGEARFGLSGSDLGGRGIGRGVGGGLEVGGEGVGGGTHGVNVCVSGWGWGGWHNFFIMHVFKQPSAQACSPHTKT